MAKTKVVFIEETQPYGRRGDIRDVAGGFFRNLLLPRGKAVLATKDRVQWAEEIQKEREAAERLHHEHLEAYAKDLNGVTLEFFKKANDKGGLFDAVDKHEILGALRQKGFTEVEEKHLDIEKSFDKIGECSMTLHLGEGLPTPTVKVIITKEEK